MAAAWEITEKMYLSDAEIRRLLAHIRGAAKSAHPKQRVAAEVDRFIIELLLYSGIRTSEFCRLRLRDAPFGKMQTSIRVRANRRQERTVFIPSHLRRLLRRFVDRIRPSILPEGAASGDLDQPLVFNDRGRPYERTALYRRVRRIMGDAGLGERASVQLLRHTYGYLAYKLTGGNLLFVQRQLGHAHPMITSVYSELIDESYESVANRISVPKCDI